MIYPNIEAFYSEDERRRRSGECDYGVWWRGDVSIPTYRISYVQATGEVYAIQLTSGYDAAEVLAVIAPDEGDIYYRTLDRILEGWPDQCGEIGSLSWVRERLEAAIAEAKGE